MIEAQNQQQHRASEKNNSTNTQQSIVGPIGGNQAAENQSAKSSQESTDNRIIWLTGVIALAAVAQVWAMIRQARYMRRGLSVTIKAAKSARFSAIAAQNAVRLAERNAAITGRAVVLVESVTVANRSSEVSQLESHNLIIFTLKNFGQTIASSVEFSGKMCGVCQWPFPDVPTFNIAPQGAFSWATPKSLGAWIGDEINISAINGRRAWLEYSVIVTYIDAFEKKHTYHCEGRYEPALKQFLITSSTSD
jgi:hypothetical protein